MGVADVWRFAVLLLIAGYGAVEFFLRWFGLVADLTKAHLFNSCFTSANILPQFPPKKRFSLITTCDSAVTLAAFSWQIQAVELRLDDGVVTQVVMKPQCFSIDMVRNV